MAAERRVVASTLAAKVKECILTRIRNVKEWLGHKYPKNERLDASKMLAKQRERLMLVSKCKSDQKDVKDVSRRRVDVLHVGRSSVYTERCIFAQAQSGTCLRLPRYRSQEPGYSTTTGGSWSAPYCPIWCHEVIKFDFRRC